MPAITYTALRSIERVSFASENQTTIAATSSGSPNVSTFTDSASPGSLSGLNSGEWIFVSGFTTAANNGWHQVSGVSSGGLITVTSILTVEAAGDTVNILGYLRGSGQQYSFDVSFTADDRDRRVTKFVNVALDGNTETLTQRRTENYNILSSALDTAESEYSQWIEFLDSCESGEAFTFDRLGSVATADDPVSSLIEGEGYIEQRLENITGRRIAFRIRVL